MEEEQTLVDEWQSVKSPPPPELKDIVIKIRETALLILDIQNQNCNNERRPRCVRSLHKLQKLIEIARRKEMAIVFTLTSAATKADMRKEILPNRSETIIKAGVDKFYKTELENILKENKIKTIIIVGTSANGAVLHTATGAAARGFEIIVPIDGISAGSLYEEQYVVWHLANAPGTSRSTSLTKTSMLEI